MAKYDDLIITVGALVLGLGLSNYITKSTMFAYASAPAKPKPVAAKPAVIKSKLPKPLTTGQLHQGQVKKVVGEQTDRTNLSFTSGIYTSKYHLYAGGLDWSKSVGLLIYTDGSGEFGLKHPKGSYLLAGNNGMIAVAKKHNMVLLTPLSPNKNCSDGDGSCWYLGDPPGYARWAEALVKQVQSQYPIDKKRIAVGGDSHQARSYSDETKRAAIADFGRFGLTDGQALAAGLGYIPLPQPVVTRALASLTAIG